MTNPMTGGSYLPGDYYGDPLYGDGASGGGGGGGGDGGPRWRNDSELDPDAWRERAETNNSDTKSKRLAARRATGTSASSGGHLQTFGKLRQSVFGGWDKDGNRTPGQGGRGLGVRFGGEGEGEGEGRGTAMAGDGGGDGGLPSSYPQRPSGVGDAEFSMPSSVERGGGGGGGARGGGGGGQQPSQPSGRNSRMSWRNHGASGGGTASGAVRSMRSASK